MTVAFKQPHPQVKTARASITFPAELYLELERIAEEKKCLLPGLFAMLRKSTSPPSTRFFLFSSATDDHKNANRDS